MRQSLYLAILAFAACKSSDASKATEPAKQQAAAAADPWAAKKAPDPKSIKDPDLAKMTELASGGPGATEYPQADAVVALDRDEITLKADGTVVEHSKSIVKLLDAQRAKEKFADVHVPFDSKRETLTIDTARTVNSDGEAKSSSPEEIGDIVPSWLSDATLYSDVRERVVTFPAVDKGSVLELEATRTSKSTPDSALGGELMIGQWDPVLERTIVITAPAGTALKYALSGIDAKPVESDGPAGHSWTFTFAKQPDRHPEMGSLDEAAVLPRLVYSFQPSWEKAIEPVAKRFLDTAVPAQLPPAIKAEADRIVAGATTDADKAHKLFAFVTHDIRGVHLPLGMAGYQPHAPEVVLANKYADPRDKVGLLLALASAEGIHGRPVLVRSGQVPVIASVPTVKQFDHIVAKLDVGGKDVWLNPSNDTAQWNIVLAGQDGLVLPLEKGGKELGQRPAADPSTSVSHTAATYVLSANGDLDASYAYETTGAFAEHVTAELRPLQGEKVDKFFQHAASSLSASAIDKGHTVGDTNSIDGKFTVTHHVGVPGYAVAQGNFRNFEIPPVTLAGVDDVPSASLSKRKTAMYVGTPRTVQGDITVQLPAGWKVAYVPQKLDGAVDGVSWSSTCSANGQTVTCHDEIKLDKLVIGTAQYAAFHDAMAKLQAYERRVVLLTRG